MKRDCPQRQGTQDLGTTQSRSAVGQERIQFIPLHPSMGQRNQYQPQGATQAPSISQTGHICQDQSASRGRAQGLQAESPGQAKQMTCYHCRQPRHMRRDYPRRQRSQGTAAEHPE